MAASLKMVALGWAIKVRSAAVCVFRWWRPAYWTWLAISLCPVAYFLPHYLLSSGHHPPVGTYIAIMGALAVAVAFRKEPPPFEKAAWIILITIVMVAEIKDLYIADDEQARKLKEIDQRLDATSQGLDETSVRLGTATDSLRGISNGITEAANKSQAQFNTTMSEMTGGSSYIFLDPIGEVTGKPLETDIGDIRKGMMVLNTGLSISGKYPLHDVDVDICGPRGCSDTYYGTVLPRSAIIKAIELGFYPIEDQEYWSIWINTSNGVYYQHIFLLKDGDKWLSAHRLYKGSSRGKMIRKWHQAGFPENVSDVPESKR